MLFLDLLAKTLGKHCWEEKGVSWDITIPNGRWRVKVGLRGSRHMAQRVGGLRVETGLIRTESLWEVSYLAC